MVLTDRKAYEYLHTYMKMKQAKHQKHNETRIIYRVIFTTSKEEIISKLNLKEQ